MVLEPLLVLIVRALENIIDHIFVCGGFCLSRGI